MSQYLKKLKKHFMCDDEAQEAISLLETKLEENPLQKKATTTVTEGFPLPKEGLEEGNIFLFTDGACRGNPGPGAWGAMAQDHQGDIVFEASHFNEYTTNNIMELTAVVAALEHLSEDLESPDQYKIHVYSDSKYVVDGMNSWVAGWKKRGWKKADKKPPENVEIWQALDAVKDHFFSVNFNWVKGHAGHPQNERVDELANIALDSAGH